MMRLGIPMNILFLGLVFGSFELRAQDPACREIGFSQAGGSTLSISRSAHDLTVGDFDGDGFDDLAVSNPRYPSGVVVNWGSDSGLSTQLSWTVSGERIFADGGPIVAARLNRDSFDDLVMQDSRNRCIALLSEGDARSFVRGPAVSCNVADLVQADVNLDGVDDILGVPPRGHSDVTVLLSNGVGGFDPIPQFQVRSPMSVFASFDVGDVSGDGIPDMVFAGPFVDTFAFPNALNRSVALALGDGGGQFELQNEGRGVWVGGWPYDLELEDMNGDGLADAVVIVDSRLEIYLARDDATFAETPATSLELPEGRRLASGDFNGDGAMDVIVNPPEGADAYRRHSIYRGDGRGGLGLDQTIVLSYRADSYPWPLVPGDFDGDDRLDLVGLERYRLADETTAVVAPLLFRNSCPVRASLRTEQKVVGFGETLRYRVTARNIATRERVSNLELDVPGSFDFIRPDDGAICSPGARCPMGDLLPGEERSALVEISLAPDTSSTARPEAVWRANLHWEGGQAPVREVTRLRLGVDLVTTLEMIGAPVLGSDVVFRLTVTNAGAEPAAAVRLTATKTLLGTVSGLCSDCRELGGLAPGATITRDFPFTIPLEGDPPDLRVSFSVQPDPGDRYPLDNSARIFVVTRRSGVQSRFLSDDISAWTVDPGIRSEHRFTSGFRIYDTGRVYQTVEGLEPGRTYSLRARMSGDREADASGAVQAVDSAGRVLGVAGPVAAGALRVLQTLVTAPPDGAVRIELLSEVNRFAVVRGEIGGVGWHLVELRPADPQTIQVPEDHRRIQEAIDAASDGDTISVGPGLYRELLDLGDKAIVLEGREGPARTIVDAGRNGDVLTIGDAPRATAVRGLTLRNGWAGARVGGAATLEGCTLTDNSIGVVAEGRAVIRHNTIRFNNEAVHAGGEVEVAANLIADSGPEPFGFVELTGSGYVFSRNRIAAHPGGSIVLRGPGELSQNTIREIAGMLVSLGSGEAPARIDNNLIVIGPERSNIRDGAGLSIETGFHPTELRNNTVVRPAAGKEPLLRVIGASGLLRLTNNIFVRESTEAAIVCGPDAVPQAQRNLVFNPAGPVAQDCDGAFTGGNTFTADPQLVSLRGNYRLRAGSPAIDAGLDGPQPATDLDGRERIRDGNGDGEARVDLGAYEYPSATAMPARSRTGARGTP